METDYRILRYLKNSPGRGLLFKKGNQCSIEAFTDANWASSVLIGDLLLDIAHFSRVIWSPGRARNIMRYPSSAEAELRAMANGVCEILWLSCLQTV